MIDNVALSEALSRLDSLGGLDSPKKMIKDTVNIVRMMQLRAEAGLPTYAIPRGMLFLGNPGTGKSITARYMGEILHALGVLSKGHVVECDRSSLVAGYVGQTAAKTQAVIDSARGGILFVDEAYNLFRGNACDFGREALDVITRNLSDPDEDLFIVLSGYEDMMMRFVRSNPSIDVKFRQHVRFENLTADEMIELFGRMLEKYKCGITDDALEAVKEHFRSACEGDGAIFGNARGVRNLLEQAVQACVMRVAATNKEPVDASFVISVEDIPKLNK